VTPTRDPAKAAVRAALDAVKSIHVASLAGGDVASRAQLYVYAGKNGGSPSPARLRAVAGALRAMALRLTSTAERAEAVADAIERERA
jgi:hypothetical protein